MKDLIYHLYDHLSLWLCIQDAFTVPLCDTPTWERAQEGVLAAVANSANEVEFRARLGLQALPGMNEVGRPGANPNTSISLTDHWAVGTI